MRRVASYADSDWSSVWRVDLAVNDELRVGVGEIGGLC